MVKIASGLELMGPIEKESMLTSCPNHPEGEWVNGFGYAGGGFGPYKLCIVDECGTVFAKRNRRD